jgi:hypothetical protein
MSKDSKVENDTKEELLAQLDYAVTPRNLLVTLEHLMSGKGKEQAAVMVWGAMGIGKTEIVRSLGTMWGCRIVALHLPQFDPTDLKGIPVRMDNGDVEWVPSSYLPKQEDIVVGKDDAKGFNKVVEFNMPNAYSLSCPWKPPLTCLTVRSPLTSEPAMTTRVWQAILSA